MKQDTEILLGPEEVLEIAALDSEFFCKTFFPETFRQASPGFMKEMWDLLEDRAHRNVAFMVFRGGAKTTTLRALTAKRIAFTTSRTIMFVSASQEHSMLSLNWLRNQIERNHIYADTFQLTRGNKWTDSHFEVRNGLTGKSTNVIAVGITGQTRGFNIDDFRPDLIVVDDPCNEENTATEEQREKIRELFFTALDKSLTPPSENPDAKMVLLQTPLDQDDLISRCVRDGTWATRIYSCYDEEGKSRWPERFSDVFLQKSKQSHITQNLLHYWLREMECKITSPEAADFRQEWLQFWVSLPEGMVTYLALDPVPPPSEREIKQGLAKKDYEVIAVIGVRGQDRFVLEYSKNHGHEPDWTSTEFFRLWEKWRPLKARVEAVAYQRTLVWILQQEMKKRGQYVQINAVNDKRSKRHRILQAISRVASSKRLYIHTSMHDFVSQYVSYPNVTHDDILDAVAMGLDEAENWVVGHTLNGSTVPEDDFRQDAWRAAP